jgi:hypothetical protein
MSQFIRTADRAPKLNDFLDSDGTPIVIDTTTDIPYYLKKNVITSLQAGGGEVVMGGIRKTTDQTIGSLGAAWVPITNYTVQVFADHPDVDTDLANGTIAFHKQGSYMLTANIEMTFTSDNNSSRKTGLRLFNATDNAAIPNASVNLYAGGYTAGFANSISIPVEVSPTTVGKILRFEIGGGDTFASVTLRAVLLSAVSLGPLL